MNKTKMMNAALAVLPLVAVLLAGMPNAVTVYYSAGAEGGAQVVYCSFFTLLEDVSGAVCMPFSGICGAVAFGMGVLYMVKKTAFWLKGIVGASFASMTLAVLPLMLQTQTYLVPNMLVPILMLVVCVLAYSMIRKPPQEEKSNKGQRLKN